MAVNSIADYKMPSPSKALNALSLAFLMMTQGGHVAAATEDETFSWNAEIETGLEHDSHLTVVELDQSLNESDIAWYGKGRVKANWQVSDATSLKGGVSHSLKQYDENDDFDTGITQVFMDASHKAGGITWGASHYYADADLDGDDLFTMNQTGLSLAKMIDSRYYLRGALDYKDKAFDQNDERDSETIVVAGDGYVFFDGTARYVSAGLSCGQEHVDDSTLDNDQYGAKLRYTQRLSHDHSSTKLGVGYRFTHRDYQRTDPTLGEKRADYLHDVSMNAEWFLNDIVSWLAGLNYRYSKSNLETVDYEELVSTLGLKVSF